MKTVEDIKDMYEEARGRACSALVEAITKEAISSLVLYGNAFSSPQVVNSMSLFHEETHNVYLELCREVEHCPDYGKTCRYLVRLTALCKRRIPVEV